MNRFIRRTGLAMAIGLLLLTAKVPAFGQNAITMYLFDRGWSGDTNYIELRAAQFQHISYFSFSLSESNQLGTLIGIDQLQLPNFSVGANYNFSNNVLQVNWTSPFINGFNIADGQPVFRIKWLSDPLLKHCFNIHPLSQIITIRESTYDTSQAIVYGNCDAIAALPSFFNAYRDANNNCLFESHENLFNDYTIQDSFNQKKIIYKNPQLLFYGKQDHGRHYYKIIPNSGLWTSCNPEQIVDVDSTTKIISLVYGLHPVISCPQLEVEVHTPVVRRCTDYTYYINYANSGTIAEDSVRIRIKLDPYMSLKAASIPVAILQFPYIEFNIGTIDIFQTGSFTITVNVDCNNTRTGQTHCLEAEILPHRDCFVSPVWSGASIKLESKCETGKAKFKIRNLGADMLEPVQYWIVEDDIMPGLKKDIKLNAGEFLDLEYPANGKTYRLITDQVKNHPGHSNPTVTLEACGRDTAGNFSTGYFLLFAEDEEDPHISIDCQASRGSFDPNDKIGLPLGYGTENFIEPQRSLEYKIRFQNTGNDTAFKVIIVDTLSEWMDLKTLKVLDASHEFTYSLVDRVLSFRFDPIYLPYQSINEEASNGYVYYSIQTVKDAPLKTKILNDATIYFDFNEGIKTNTTLHTLATDFIIVSVSPADPDNTQVNIYPNPGTDYLIIDAPYMNDEKFLHIYDVFGNTIQTQLLYGRNAKLILKNLQQAGVYYLQLRDANNRSFTRKILVNAKN